MEPFSYSYRVRYLGNLKLTQGLSRAYIDKFT